jgi:hypothetical protein
LIYRLPTALPYSEKEMDKPNKKQRFAKHSPWFKPWAMME